MDHKDIIDATGWAEAAFPFWSNSEKLRAVIDAAGWAEAAFPVPRVWTSAEWWEGYWR